MWLQMRRQPVQAMESSRSFAQTMGTFQDPDGAKGVRRITYGKWRMVGRWSMELVFMNFPRCTRFGKCW